MSVPPKRRARRFAIGLGVVLILSLIGVGLTFAIAEWRFSYELDQATREMNLGQTKSARDALATLARRRPGQDAVEYRLGLCEVILNAPDAAIDAWGRVPADSEYAPQAYLERSKLALQKGKLSIVEESLDRLKNQDGEIGYEAGRLREQLLLFSGRSRDIGLWLQRRWNPDRDAVAVLKAHWLLDTQPIPIGPISERLDQMEKDAPDDDRVWLGRADLNTRIGRFDEADALLKRCEERRPNDPDVWRARLEWAFATRNLGEADRALTHLPAESFTLKEVAATRVRLANLEANDEAERKALETLVELDPGDASAWGRLADLSARGGQTDQLSQARKRKDELDRARDEYRRLMGDVAPDNPAHAAELAKFAEQLGRPFEARAWWIVESHRAPQDKSAQDNLARLGTGPFPIQSPTAARGGTVGELLVRNSASTTNSRKPARVSPSLIVPVFRDEAESSGLRFTYDNDQSPLRRLPETMGGGVGLIDYDGDGRLDVYCVQGGKFPTGADGPTGGDRLFRNKSDGKFEDVTDQTKISSFKRGFGHGVAVADYDNDGRSDLFVTRWGQYALYRNKGDGTFEDVTERVGLGGDRGWPTSAAFADFDGDGDLDLYVCQYLRWSPTESIPCPNRDRPGTNVYCVPRAFEAEPDRLFRNDGGKYVDISQQAGIVDKDGRGLGVVIADLDDDGRVDIYVANDMTPNYFFRNLGGMKFEEVGLAAGAAVNGTGGYQAGMGIACGDLVGDGRLDLAVTNFYGESTTIFHNLGGGSFADWTSQLGMLIPSRHMLGFGAAFLDADNDGKLDLATANGHVNDYRPSTPYDMPAQLYLGIGGGKLVDVSQRAGECWSVPRVGRGLAIGDLDNDGRQDVLIHSPGGPLAHLRNLGAAPAAKASDAHFLTLQLVGAKSNRDAIGARVRLEIAGKKQVAWRLSGSSFLSANDARIHFGLGSSSGPINLEILWPNGRVDRHQGLQPDGEYRIVEGNDRAEARGSQKGPS